YAANGLFDSTNTFADVDVRARGKLEEVVDQFRPQAVVNCIGIVKQRPESEDAIVSIEVNSLMPHRLGLACRAAGARLIHLSTDCVFTGERGRYSETDRADAVDLYGRSKLLGEVSGEG